MKRASQILTHRGIINGEQHLLPLKNKTKTDEKNKIN